MAESRLKVILETAGMGAVKAAMRGVNQLKESVKKLDDQFRRSIPLQTKFNRALKRTQIAAIRAARGVRKAAQSLSSLQGVLGGLAIGAFFKSAIDEARDYEAAILRIGRLEGQFKNLAGLQETAAKTAKDLFVSQTQAARGYANLAARIGPSVKSVKELQAVYEGLEIVLLKNAKTTQEAASLQLQLNQALGKGTLNGDEFRTIAENAPEILRQLAKDAGVAESAIKDLASKGFITTEKLIKALANLRNSGIEDFNALLDSTLGKQRKFDKALSDLRKTVGEQLLPAFAPLIEALTFIAKAFTALPKPIQRFLVALTGVLAVVSVLAPLIAGLTLAVVVLGGKFIIVAGLVTALGLALFELPNIFRDVVNTFKDELDGLAKLWDGLIKNLSGAWNAFCTFLKNAWKNTIPVLGTILEAFGLDSVKIFEGIGKAWQGLTTFMSKVWGDMLNLLGNDFKNFFNAFGEISKLTGGFGGPIGQLFEVLRNLTGLKFPEFGGKGSGLDKLNLNLDTSLTNPELEGGGKGAKEAEKRAKAQKDQLRAAEDLLRAALDENQILTSNSELEKIRNQAAVDRSNIAIKYGRLAEKAKSDAEVEKLVLAQSAEVLNTKTKEAKALNDEYKKIAKSMEAIFEEGKKIDEELKGPFKELAEEVVPAIGDAIKDSIVTALEAAIKGTEDLGKSLQKIASDLLMKVGGMFLDAGFAGLGKNLKLPGFAEGGYVTGPTPALVGEGGEPEYIVPASKMESALARYSAGARGDAVVNGSEMIGEGGTAIAERPLAINISGGVMQMGGEEYIRKDQLPSIIRQSAEAGERMTLRKMQQSSSTRRKVGI